MMNAPIIGRMRPGSAGSGQSGADARQATRQRLSLEAIAHSGRGDGDVVQVHNVSSSGMLLSTALALGVGDEIEVELPGIPDVRACVVWSSGAFHGCAFAVEIPASALRVVDDIAGAALPAPALNAEPERVPVPLLDSLGERIFQLRKLQGLTLEKLATMLGVSKPTVWAWEKGRARPSRLHLDALARALNVTRSELLAKEPDRDVTRLVVWCREQIAAALATDSSKIRIYFEM